MVETGGMACTLMVSAKREQRVWCERIPSAGLPLHSPTALFLSFLLALLSQKAQFVRLSLLILVSPLSNPQTPSSGALAHNSRRPGGATVSPLRKHPGPFRFSPPCFPTVKYPLLVVPRSRRGRR